MVEKSKNSRVGRGKYQAERRLNGEPVKAVLYVGRHAGHGTYMSGSVGGTLVRDGNDKPLPIRKIGVVE